MSPHRMPISQVQGMMYANNGQQMVQQPIQYFIFVIFMRILNIYRRAPSQTSFAQMSAQPQQIQQVYMSNQIRQPMHSIPIAHQYVQQQHFQQQQQQQSQLTQVSGISASVSVKSLYMYKMDQLLSISFFLKFF